MQIKTITIYILSKLPIIHINSEYMETENTCNIKWSTKFTNLKAIFNPFPFHLFHKIYKLFKIVQPILLKWTVLEVSNEVTLMYPFISNQIDHHSTISKLTTQKSNISGSENDSSEK